MLYPILEEEYQARVKVQQLSDLQSHLGHVLKDFEIEQTQKTINLVSEFVRRYRELRQPCFEAAQVRFLLERCGMKYPPKGPDHRLLQNFMRRLEDHTREVVKAALKRRGIKRLVMDEVWTEENIQEALHILIVQEILDMNIVLFLDALDEYSGRPEFIASSIQSLVKKSKESHTQIRIIFSSRPWPAFQNDFADYPCIQIHEHTQGDIMNYTAESISSRPMAKTFIAPLVPVIVRRARGVFLWVKLVMRDLIAIIGSTALGDNQQLADKLKQVLDSLPDELDEYYRAIVERISMATRWDTYVMLETLRCANEPMNLPELRIVLEWSQEIPAQTDAKRRRRTQTQRQIFPKHITLPEHLLATATGGLIDIVQYSDGAQEVQFAHQTVKEFTELPQFKTLVLGNSRASITPANGNSFLASYHFVIRGMGAYRFTSEKQDEQEHLKLFIYYARKAEKSTGISQFRFLSQLSSSNFPWNVNNHLMSSLLALALYSGLQLCLKDMYDVDSDCIANFPTSDDVPALLSFLYQGYKQVYSEEEAVDIAKWLIKSGGATGLCNRKELRALKGFINESQTQPTLALLASSFINALPHTARLERNTQNRNDELLHVVHEFDTELLHSCAPSYVFQIILEQDVNPNSLLVKSSEEYTPMDSVLYHWSTRGTAYNACQECYLLCKMLMNKGGLLHKTPRYKWKTWIATFEKNGLDVNVFKEAGFPQWYQDSKLKRVNRWMDGVREILL